MREIKYNKPKSFCRCGHLGDGLNSQHSDTLTPGHGGCKVKGCKCEQFTWTKWTPEFAEYLKNLKV